MDVASLTFSCLPPESIPVIALAMLGFSATQSTLISRDKNKHRGSEVKNEELVNDWTQRGAIYEISRAYTWLLTPFPNPDLHTTQCRIALVYLAMYLVALWYRWLVCGVLETGQNLGRLRLVVPVQAWGKAYPSKAARHPGNNPAGNCLWISISPGLRSRLSTWSITQMSSSLDPSLGKSAPHLENRDCHSFETFL